MNVEEAISDGLNGGLISVVCVGDRVDNRRSRTSQSSQSMRGSGKYTAGNCFSPQATPPPRDLSPASLFNRALKEDLMTCFSEWTQSQTSTLEIFFTKHQDQLDAVCKQILAALQDCNRAAVNVQTPAARPTPAAVWQNEPDRCTYQSLTPTPNSHQSLSEPNGCASQSVTLTPKPHQNLNESNGQESQSLTPNAPALQRQLSAISQTQEQTGNGNVALPNFEIKKAIRRRHSQEFHEGLAFDREDLESKVRPEVMERFAERQKRLRQSVDQTIYANVRRTFSPAKKSVRQTKLQPMQNDIRQTSRTDVGVLPSSTLSTNTFGMGRNTQTGFTGLLSSIVSGPKGNKRWGVFKSMADASNMTARFQGSLDDEEEVTRLQLLVRSTHFDMLCAAFIISFMVLLGVETDDTVQRGGKTSTLFFVIALCFNGWFTIELLLRLSAESIRSFFCGEDSFLNCMDVCLVLTSVVDLIMGLCFGGDGDISGLDTDAVGRLMRAVRVMRAVRIVRLARFMRYIYQLRKMVCLIQGCFSTLFWCMVMLFAFVYTFALLFTQGVTDYILRFDSDEEGKPDHLHQLQRSFGSIGQSMSSLFQTMSTGVSWGLMFDPLVKTGWLYSSIYIVFVTLSLFGILNVMTSVFVESTMKSALSYRDLIITDSERNKAIATEHLRELFTDIDIDGDGSLSMDEMMYFLADSTVYTYMEALDINLNDARTLFKLIDTDESGTIDIDEFCDGCMRLKGEAKAFDIHCLIHEMSRFFDKWSVFTEYISQRLGPTSPDSMAPDNLGARANSVSAEPSRGSCVSAQSLTHGAEVVSQSVTSTLPTRPLTSGFSARGFTPILKSVPSRTSLAL